MPSVMRMQCTGVETVRGYFRDRAFPVPPSCLTCFFSISELSRNWPTPSALKPNSLLIFMPAREATKLPCAVDISQLENGPIILD